MLTKKEQQLKILQEKNNKIVSSYKAKFEFDKNISLIETLQKKLNSSNLSDAEYEQEKNKIQEKEWDLFYKIKAEITKDKKIIEIENKMAELNKLDNTEKNIHAIWIGIPSKDEFDNLKLWAKYNPDYKIHLWTDSAHVLAQKLGTLIFNNAKQKSNGSQFEANTKDHFYHNLNNSNNTFDEKVIQYLITNSQGSKDKKIKAEKFYTDLVSETKKRIITESQEIKKYTNSEVILHDIAIEKDIFPTKKYYEGYLNTLEHLHIAAGASDRLRYAILNKYGGVYLDTDLMINFNLEKIKNNQKINNLIETVKWTNEFYDNSSWLKSKPDMIINQIILFDKLNQLNDEKLSDFAKKWEKNFRGHSVINFKIFKDIVEEYKKMNLNLKPQVQLSKFPINNSLQTSFFLTNNSTSNAFIVSKKNSKFLQELMRKIEATDNKIEAMFTNIKIINKKDMIIHHTGPGNINNSLCEIEENYFFHSNQKNAQIVTLETINSLFSSWAEGHNHPYIIKDEEELKSLFWSNKEETKNYFKNVDLQAKEFQNLTLEEEKE